MAACSAPTPPASGERIVSVAPNLTEMLFAAGAADQLVAVSEYSDWPEQAKSLPRIGDAFRLDYESIVALRPTVAVIWATGTPAGVAERLESLGIKVVGIPTHRLDDVAAGLETLGELAGTQEVARQAAAGFRARIAGLREEYRARGKLKVFIQIDDAPLYTVGGGHLITEIVELCGGENVFADSTALALPVDLESVLARAPQVMLSTDDGDPVAFWSRFGGLAAVATGSVYRAPADLLARPSPRIAEGAARVCEMLDDARERQSPAPADRFLSNLSRHCGQAFAGRIVANVPQPDSDPFTGKALVMHLRECRDGELRIPFHVGGDRSRTWVLTRTPQGLRLKHDHRHEDGSDDAVTMYGGDTATVGTAMRQEFPVDAESIALFEREGLAASVTNVWAMEIEPGRRFLYELRRPSGRLFQVEFDLTRPVTPPPAPWGH
ncbi:MAG: cobalamin-binding protein [Steroidobacteraceae bacterium]|nr:cobalamin-binding protein [Steroidobacteraceae bacterium]